MASFPAHYKDNFALLSYDAALMRQADKLLRKVNFGLDRERAQMFETIARPHARAALLYGAAHYRGKGGEGIDDFLPRQDQVLVFITDANGIKAVGLHENIMQPDFVLRVDEGRAYVQPSAIEKGLFPKF